MYAILIFAAALSAPDPVLEAKADRAFIYGACMQYINNVYMVTYYINYKAPVEEREYLMAAYNEGLTTTNFDETQCGRLLRKEGLIK